MDLSASQPGLHSHTDRDENNCELLIANLKIRLPCFSSAKYHGRCFQLKFVFEHSSILNAKRQSLLNMLGYGGTPENATCAACKRLPQENAIVAHLHILTIVMLHANIPAFSNQSWRRAPSCIPLHPQLP